jgi:hypothetical protein
MHRTVPPCAALAALLAASVPAWAQEQSFGELESRQPHRLSREELQQLWPGAAVSRVSARGSTHRWTNEPDGSFIVSTDNAGVGPRAASSTHGKWSVSEDGRLCVTIEWRLLPTEDWCRYVFQTSDGYYTTRAESPGAGDKVFRLDIRKKS